MMRNLTPIVKQLLIINILFFIGCNVVGKPALDYLAMHYPENPNFYFWQPITSMFVHFDILHIAFNMFALYMFGPILEERWGSTKFLFFYLSSALGARLVTFGVDYFAFQQGLELIMQNGFTKDQALNIMSQGQIYAVWQDFVPPNDLYNFQRAYGSVSLGASGALAGMLAAIAVIFPDMPMGILFIPIPIKAKYLVLSFFTLDLIIGLLGRTFHGVGEGVGHFAHFGGALIGFIMAWYWKRNQFNPNRWN